MLKKRTTIEYVQYDDADINKNKYTTSKVLDIIKKWLVENQMLTY